MGGGLISRRGAPVATMAKDSHLPVLRMDGVSLSFDGLAALRDVSVSVGRGELVAVVGPSGCGKSTLLRLAAGLLPAADGSVARNADETGFVFQDPTLLPWRTVQGNVELLCELQGMSRAQRRARALDMIGLVGLSGFEGHRPRALSGGMRMRVSLARALVLQPSLFLFDEPFAAVDELTRERLNDELLAIAARQRFGALFVTHSVTEAVYLATRVVVLSARPGTVVAEIAVPFGYPRTSALRFTPEFAAVAGRVAAALREGAQ